MKCFFSLYLLLFVVNSEAQTLHELKFNGEDFQFFKIDIDTNLKVKYIVDHSSSGEIELKINQLKNQHNVFLVASAGYINKNYENTKTFPVGFSSKNGKIINQTILLNRLHAMVFLENNSILISKIDKGNINLKNKSFDLNNALELYRYKNAIKENELSAFQTHLLIWENKLEYFDTINNINFKRERRFLAHVEDSIGKQSYVIVNIPNWMKLKEASAFTKQYLNNNESFFIKTMINLDTGGQDVFEIYSKNKEKININGQAHINEAITVLVFYK